MTLGFPKIFRHIQIPITIASVNPAPGQKSFQHMVLFGTWGTLVLWGFCGGVRFVLGFLVLTLVQQVFEFEQLLLMGLAGFFL